MSTRNDHSHSRRGRRLRLALGGGAVVVVLIVGALAVNAVYWINRLGGIEAVRASAAEPGVATDMTPVAFESLPPGDAAAGEVLFNGALACSACHSLEPGKRVVGPSLAGVAARAVTVQPDVTAEAYLLESIVDPNAHVVEGYDAGLMPANFGGRLSVQEQADLVAYLMTLE